jgi:hypothetical protein
MKRRYGSNTTNVRRESKIMEDEDGSQQIKPRCANEGEETKRGGRDDLGSQLSSHMRLLHANVALSLVAPACDTLAAAQSRVEGEEGEGKGTIIRAE